MHAWYPRLRVPTRGGAGAGDARDSFVKACREGFTITLDDAAALGAKANVARTAAITGLRKADNAIHTG